jgi:WD40 repeat protein
MDQLAGLFRATAAFCVLCGLGSISVAEPNILFAAREIACQSAVGRPAVVSSVALSPDARLIMAATDAHEVAIVDTATGTIQQRLELHADWVRSIATQPNGQLFASAGHDRIVRLSNQSSNLVAGPMPIGEAVAAVAIHPSGQQLAAVGFGDTLRILNVSDGQSIQTFECAGVDQRALAFSPDGERIAAAGRNGRIRVWGLSSGIKERDIETDGRPIRSLAFSPNSQLLAAAGEGAQIRSFDAATGQARTVLEARPAKIYAIAFVNDTTLATAGSDNLIRVWDLVTAQPTILLTGHTGTVSSLVVGSAGTLLVSGSYDTTIRVWDLPTVATQSPLPLTAGRYAPPVAR